MRRRSFIKKSTLLAGAVFSYDQLWSADPLLQDTIALGIIGCGSRGTGIMSTIRKELPGTFTIAALCDTLEFRLKEAKQMPGTGNPKTYSDYRSLLDDKNVQAVVIATPLYLHYQMALDALKAGKHVYLEKTMTYSIEQAIDLVKLSRSFPRQTLQIGHQLIYSPLYSKVKEMIGKGYLGKITQVDCRYDRNSDWRKPVNDPALEKKINWRMYKAYSGGLTAELLSHQIQFINWALDTHPAEVFSTGGIDFYKDGRETYDNVQVMMRYDREGIVGNFGSTLANEREGFIFKIKGSKGAIELLLNEGVYYPEKETRKQLQTVDGVTGATKIEWKEKGGISVLKEIPADPTFYSIKDFHACIRENRRPLCDVLTGARAAISIHLANNALYGRKVEHWSSRYDLG